MQRNALLTQDELDFIQAMQHSPQSVAEAASSLVVDGGSQIKALLARLIAHEQVTIQAQFENQQMNFPLHLVEDEFHAMHLQLGAPSIYEDGPVVRPWRLLLDQPLALEDDKARPTALFIREISCKDVLIENRASTKPPKRLRLWFKPKGHAPIALRASLSRETDDGLAAYNLNQDNVQEAEQLRQYILAQHRRAHPQLHR
ncbi:hypothetical protein D9M71_133640 [compost metagenome]